MLRACWTCNNHQIRLHQQWYVTVIIFISPKNLHKTPHNASEYWFYKIETPGILRNEISYLGRANSAVNPNMLSTSSIHSWKEIKLSTCIFIRQWAETLFLIWSNFQSSFHSTRVYLLFHDTVFLQFLCDKLLLIFLLSFLVQHHFWHINSNWINCVPLCNWIHIEVCRI